MPEDKQDAPSTDALFEYVHPDQLRFDPDNPRFGGELTGKTQDEIRDFLYGKPHFAAELVDSFLQNGYIDYEPLIARKEGDHWVVIEGNRRLAALKHILANSSNYVGKVAELKRIPILSFPEGHSAKQVKEMRVYLGVRHLFGFREWPSLSKAKFLHQEISSKDDVARVVKELGLEKQEIRRLLLPYRALQKANQSVPEDEDYWKLGEALARSGVKSYIQLDVDKDTLHVNGVDKTKLKNLLDFVYGKPDKTSKVRQPDTAVVTDTRQLSKLARVLEDSKAATVLEKGSSLDDASLFIESKDESLTRLARILKQLKTLLKSVFSLRPDSSQRKKLLTLFQQFEDAANRFIKHADSDI